MKRQKASNKQFQRVVFYNEANFGNSIPWLKDHLKRKLLEESVFAYPYRPLFKPLDAAVVIGQVLRMGVRSPYWEVTFTCTQPEETDEEFNKRLAVHLQNCGFKPAELAAEIDSLLSKNEELPSSSTWGELACLLANSNTATWDKPIKIQTPDGRTIRASIYRNESGEFFLK
jgi:hypothetical protein